MRNRLIATTTTIQNNNQPKNENKQIDVGEVHAQSTGQILIVPISAGHRVEVHESRTNK
jgi:hypothetical protein